MSLPPQCISPNPDIAGVGIRVAIYIQAVLSIVHPMIAASDGIVDSNELKSLGRVYLGILLPGCALLISTIIQAKTFGLSVYHGLVVLNLSWINNTSALTFFLFGFLDQMFDSSTDSDLDPEEPKQETNSESEIQDLDKIWRDCIRQAGILWDDVEPETSRTVLEDGIEERSGIILSDGESWITEVHEILGKIRHRVKKPEKAMDLVKQCRDLIERVEAEGRELAESQETLAEKLLIQKALALLRVEEMILRAQLTTMERQLGFLHYISHTGPIPNSVWVIFFTASAHLILFAGFGLWLWLTVRTFGRDQECTPYTHFFVLYKAIPVTSERLRKASIAIYVLLAIPISNIAVCTLMVLLIALAVFPITFVISVSFIIYAAWRPNAIREDFLKAFLHIYYAFVTFLMQLYFIICTELTIKHNRHLLITGNNDPVSEGDWTFGQTLAVTLTAVPLIEVVLFGYKAIFNSGARPGDKKYNKDSTKISRLRRLFSYRKRVTVRLLRYKRRTEKAVATPDPAIDHMTVPANAAVQP